MSQGQPLSSLAPEYSMTPPRTPSPACEKPCMKEIHHCEKKDVCHHNNGVMYGWGWLGALLLWFIVFIVLFWLIYYSLKPSFVLQTGSNQVDTAKVLLAAVISALILIIIIWLIKVAVTRRY